MLQCASVWRMNAYVNRRSIAEFCNHALVMWGNSYNWVNRIRWARRPKLIVCTNMFQLKLENVSSTQLSNLSYAFTTSETENFPFFGETFLHTSFACLNIWNIYTHKFPIYFGIRKWERIHWEMRRHTIVSILSNGSSATASPQNLK